MIWLYFAALKRRIPVHSNYTRGLPSGVIRLIKDECDFPEQFKLKSKEARDIWFQLHPGDAIWTH